MAPTKKTMDEAATILDKMGDLFAGHSLPAIREAVSSQLGSLVEDAAGKKFTRQRHSGHVSQPYSEARNTIDGLFNDAKAKAATAGR